MKSRVLTGPIYSRLLWELTKSIPKGKYKGVYGVPRGGLIPAVYLSHYLNIPLISTLDIGQEILVVDDIVDTGDSLRKLSDIFDVASLFWRRSASFEPTYWVYDAMDKWIVFPYEEGGLIE